MKEKKKLLYFVEAMGGGIFSYIVDLSNKLIDNYDIYIAYGIRPQTPVDYKEYFKEGIHLIEVKNFSRSLNPILALKAANEMKQIEKKVRPDIIHFHSSIAGVLGRLFLSNKNHPLFYTPHGYSFLMQDCSVIKRTIYRTIEKICALSKCTTISCSKGEHLESLKLTKSAEYVNNGIDIDSLNEMISCANVKINEKYSVYTLGRICYQKNPELFNRIALDFPDVSFTWIGDGELRNVLTAPNITITGWCDHFNALQKALSSNIFVLTSLWEGLPISLLESMYIKKYCIVSNVIGNNDVIQNGRNGFVCNDEKEFVSSIQTVLSKNCQFMINSAYDDIINHYSTEKMAGKYKEIYEKHLERKKY